MVKESVLAKNGRHELKSGMFMSNGLMVSGVIWTRCCQREYRDNL